MTACLRTSALALLLCGTLAARAEESPRSAMRKGLKAYQTGNYTNAVEWLEKAVPQFPETTHYNLGNAYYRQGAFEQAADHFNEALRSEDLALQAKAYYNRGNALLAQTTALTEKEQIGVAIELAFRAQGMYRKALLLAPDDLDAKQNFERAQRLRLQLEHDLGRWYYEHAESLLTQFKAKAARDNYNMAKQQFEHILENVDPTHAESKRMLPIIEERLEMLGRAVEDAENDLKLALKQIDDYQYMLAAQRLTMETDERKYAFDIKPELKKQYEETIKKNVDVLKIIDELSNLNIVK